MEKAVCLPYKHLTDSISREENVIFYAEKKQKSVKEFCFFAFKILSGYLSIPRAFSAFSPITRSSTSFFKIPFR